ncbi:Gfo/Idh/MocA family protein [Cohnella rhizosphaerae]|uniref:Gfo/Idh/MocA family oxidoreductase n=1 Tax=Cohnella rhizosphaerae TaxID=1457232 RepID=A0A9X4QXG4_9BACL|nr:Gfo/Idh/MocA family oxidoreductase [Cohnella rhizosphaerae]MDG0814558.1 Gfo/Idh/MocA family oxidoreductase [Cohnella rhizosphaerae]
MEKLKVGIIGFGSWGESHLEAYRALPFVEVAAVCDAQPGRRDRARELGIERVCETADELLREEGIGLVSVVTYEKEHLRPVLAALAAGKHVLVEKPVATDAAEAAQMLEASRRYGRFVAPGHLLRFEPKYAEVRDLIASGALGRPASIYMKRSRNHSLFGTYRRTHTVYELMIHDLDQAIWYAGSRVKRVTAEACSLSGSETPEILWAQLRFENGMLAVLHSNWMTHDAAGVVINDYTEVIGTEGTVQFDTDAAGVQLLGVRGAHLDGLVGPPQAREPYHRRAQGTARLHRRMRAERTHAGDRVVRRGHSRHRGRGRHRPLREARTADRLGVAGRGLGRR